MHIKRDETQNYNTKQKGKNKSLENTYYPLRMSKCRKMKQNIFF